MMIVLAILKILISCAANIDFLFSMQATDDRLSLLQGDDHDDDYGNDDHDNNFDHNHVKDDNISLKISIYLYICF